VLSFINTGNPIYPLLTKYYPAGLSLDLINPLYAVRTIFNLFLHNQDPINPIYFILLPLLALSFRKMDDKFKPVMLYSAAALLVWYLTPNTGGGRFILPYLPVFSILSVYLIYKYENLKKFLVMAVIIIAVSSIGYRLIATAKVLPVILGFEEQSEYLSNNLNFSFGDFYDTDGFFAKNITSEDRVLLYGFHNLAYVDFPFIDNSYAKVGDRFNYIVTQNTSLPSRFSFWHLIYQNPKTHVNVYSMGGADWYY
jgi:hypothetical protein